MQLLLCPVGRLSYRDPVRGATQESELRQFGAGQDKVESAASPAIPELPTPTNRSTSMIRWTMDSPRP